MQGQISAGYPPKSGSHPGNLSRSRRQFSLPPLHLAPAANSRSHRYISLPPQSRTHLTRPFAIFQQSISHPPDTTLRYFPTIPHLLSSHCYLFSSGWDRDFWGHQAIFSPVGRSNIPHFSTPTKSLHNLLVFLRQLDYVFAVISGSKILLLRIFEISAT